ncbi:MAG: hypothetical protein JKY65_15790 [Planctomycetes bacterium]|nr:hypothetical protein [Planctomycetota bacterium]
MKLRQVLFSCALLPFALAAQALAQDSTPETLQERVSEQDETIRRLEERLDRLEGKEQPAEEEPPEEESAPEASPPAHAAEEAYEQPWTERIELGMFYILDKEKHWRIDVRGRLMTDGRFLPERGHDDFNNGFQVRRARIEFRAKVYERISFDLGIEAGRTSDADLRNAYVTLQVFDPLRIRVGQMLLPYSTERLTSSKFLRHPERSILVASMVGLRDIGVLVHGPLFDGLAYYGFGLFNGNGQNQKLDTDDDFDFAARFEFRPFTDDTLRITTNYIYTPRDQTSAGPGDLRTVGNQFTKFLDYDSANRRRGRRHRAGGGILFSHGPFEVTSEVNFDYHEKVRSPTTTRSDLLNWAWFVGATWVITGEDLKQKHDGARVKPAAPLFDPSTGAMGPGAFQLSVRYEDLTIDKRTIRQGFAVGTDRVRALASTLHWYPWTDVRFSFNYTYSNFDDGVFDSKGRRHKDDHAIVTRFAFWF